MAAVGVMTDTVTSGGGPTGSAPVSHQIDSRPGWNSSQPEGTCWNCMVLVAAARGRPRAGSGRKGWVTAFRDATIFKVCYGWACAVGPWVRR
jgi:hypothetical protein